MNRLFLAPLLAVALVLSISAVSACNDSSDDQMPAPDTAIDLSDGSDDAGDTGSDTLPDGEDDGSTDVSDTVGDGQTDLSSDISDVSDSGDANVDGNTDTLPDGSDVSDVNADGTNDTASDMDTNDMSDAANDGDMNSTGGCISGATGTHVVRFTWDGSTSGSTAQVFYDANTLPDTTRWKVGAYSQSFSYTPTFQDTFLGEGGLEVSGTVFIDVEISTAGLSNVSNATLAIYGRSYNTTSSGSFEWQTFSGVGASPYGGVANSAPYEWYSADATAALPAGDSGVLLRIEAGPPSRSLIVRRVEICFDAS